MNLKWRGCSFSEAASLGLLLALAGLALVPAARAQAGAPGKSPEQTAPQKDSPDQPQGGEGEYKIRSNVQLVTTPVTVFDSGGQFVYDLEKDEFKILDNGQQQRIVQFDSEMRRLSLVIVVETNDTTAPFLDSVRPLGSMFSEMVMGPQGEVAVLTYSDHVDMPLDFTPNGDKLDTVLRRLQGRAGGMHLDDALVRALSMLNSRPQGDRKVAIVFSDGFNIGSKMSRREIVQGAMNSNITIYHLGFSPVKGLWKKPAKDPAPDLVAESVARPMGPNQPATPTYQENTWDTADVNLLGILLGLGEEAKKPLFKDSMIYFARYSGGQSYQKWGKDTVQEALNHIATEIHSQYELAYSPTTPIEPGFHKIEVEVRRPGAKVRARAGWFYQGEPARGVVVK
ncbi:MAG: VWA domain-containing protein [Terriglobia bacterium]|jgi:VWFA-related protein